MFKQKMVVVYFWYTTFNLCILRSTWKCKGEKPGSGFSTKFSVGSSLSSAGAVDWTGDIYGWHVVSLQRQHLLQLAWYTSTFQNHKCFTLFVIYRAATAAAVKKWAFAKKIKRYNLRQCNPVKVVRSKKDLRDVEL